MQDDEIPFSLIEAKLEVNDETRLRKPYIVAGTGLFKGEDVAVRGMVYVFEMIQVVPEKDRPETRHKMRLITRESVRGAVTSVCDIKGYLLNMQGLKVLCSCPYMLISRPLFA